MLNVILKCFLLLLVVVAGYLLPRGWPLLRMASVSLMWVYFPAVTMLAVVQADGNSFFVLSVSSFFICSLMALCAQFFTSHEDLPLARATQKLAFSTYNIGLFGLPIVHTIGSEWGSYVFSGILLGTLLFNSIYSSKLQSVQHRFKYVKIFATPVIYGAILGLIIKHFGTQWIHKDLMAIVKHAIPIFPYVGMLTLGIYLRQTKICFLHWQAIAKFITRKAICGLLVTGVIAIVFSYFGILPWDVMIYLFLVPILPMAISVIPQAVLHRKLSHENSTAVLGSLVLTSMVFSVVTLTISLSIKSILQAFLI